MAETVQTSNCESMFSVSVPEAVMPPIKMLLELARLRKDGADVGRFWAGNRESNAHDKDLMRQEQERTAEVYGTGSVDDINPQGVHNEADRSSRC